MPTITEFAVASADFSILVAALSHVDSELPGSDLVSTLGEETGDFTVFAPINSAFARLAVDLGFEGNPENFDDVGTFLLTGLPVETVRDVLLYHVVGSSFTAAEIAAEGSVASILGPDVALDSTTLVDLEPDLLDPSIVTTNVAADNGVVHIIDRVLLPIDLPDNENPTITGLVGASGDIDRNGADFDLLLAAVTATGLVDVLNEPEADLTVFAPNDDAFLATAGLLGFSGESEGDALDFILRAFTLLGGGDPLPLLGEVLTYHVVGESLQASQVLAAEYLVTLQGGTLTVDGSMLFDADPDVPDPSILGTDIMALNGIVHVLDGVLLPLDILATDGSNDVDLIFAENSDDLISTGADRDYIDAAGGNDTVFSGAGNDNVLGFGGNDRLIGGDGHDMISGGAGADTLNGGDGNDTINGGDADVDLRDLIFAGDGRDFVSGGAGNDQIFGMGGSDVISGGHGADVIEGQNGSDVLAGNGLSDTIFGGSGSDFLNGGFGFDLLYGGSGADRFYHSGEAGHGSDWIRDFNNNGGDTLVFGASGATLDDFVVHFNDATSAVGERAGDDDIQEAFVDYNGQVLFALVDGAAQDSLYISLDSIVYDLLG